MPLSRLLRFELEQPVIGIIAGVVAATVLAVIPWSQDAVARGNLDAVRTAQSVSRAQDGGFKDYQDLIASGYIHESNKVDAVTDTGGTCYVAVSKSDSGSVFFSTSRGPGVSEYTEATPAEATRWCVNDGVLEGVIYGVGYQASRPVCNPNDIVSFADPDLETRVRQVAELPPTGTIIVSDISTVAMLPATSPEFDNLSGVECMTGLQQVIVQNTSITSLQPLSGLPNVTLLVFVRNADATNVRIPALPSLVQLQFTDNSQISDFTISGFPALQQLSLTDNASLESIEIYDLPELTDVNIDPASVLVDLTVRDLPNLVNLNGTSGYYAPGAGAVLSNLPNLNGAFFDNTTGLASIVATNTSSGIFSSRGADLETVDITSLVSGGIYVGNNPKLKTVSILDSTSDEGIFLKENSSLTDIYVSDTAGDVYVNDDPKLEKLVVTGGSSSTGIFVGNNPLLNDLTISAVSTPAIYITGSDINNLSGIENIPTLSILGVSGSASLTTVGSVTGLTGLDTVILNNNPNLNNLNGIEPAITITDLSVANSGITSLMSLFGMSGLLNLDLTGASSSAAQIDELLSHIPGVTITQ